MDAQVSMGPTSIADVEYTLRDQELMSLAIRYFRWQSRVLAKEIGNRVVEVGCGIGNFTKTITDREAVLSTDTEKACVERHRARFAGFPNIQSRVLDVADAEFTQLRGFGADSVLCVNVMEHVGEDRGAMRNIAAILEPGGCAVVLVPAFPALYGPIDRHLNHHRRYTRKTLKALGESAQLRVKKMSYMNMAGFAGWWVNAKILSLAAHSPTQIRIFDRLIVPVESRIEAVIAPPFGQSLIAIFEKA